MKNGAGALIQADKDIYMCVCVCVRLPREERLLRDRVGGLSRWICQKPGAVLCTIRIKVSISGCYLLRDVLCSPF